METKHTPGPWTIGKVDPRCEMSDWVDEGGYRIDAPGVEQICYVWNLSRRILPDGDQANGPEFGSSEAEANAYAIHAVPELLDVAMALKTAIDDDLIQNTTMQDSLGVLSDFVNAAISKALGHNA